MYGFYYIGIYNPHLSSFHGYIYQTYQMCMYPIWSCPAELWQGDVAALRALIEDGHEAWPYFCRILGGFCDLYECNRRNLNNPGSKPMKSRSGVGQILWEALTKKKKPMKWMHMKYEHAIWLYVHKDTGIYVHECLNICSLEFWLRKIQTICFAGKSWKAHYLVACLSQWAKPPYIGGKCFEWWNESRMLQCRAPKS